MDGAGWFITRRIVEARGREVLSMTFPRDVVSSTDANGSKAANTLDCMGIKLNSAITPATGGDGTNGQAFQHGFGRRTFIGSPNGRMRRARHEAATQCQETGRGLTTKVPAGRLNFGGDGDDAARRTPTTTHKCGTGRRAKATVLKAS